MKLYEEINFKALFEEAPGLILVLNPSFTILAISDAYVEATYTKREDLLGKHFFDVFQDTKNTTAVVETKASMEYVLKNKKPHVVPMLRMEIKNLAGVLEEKYWNPINKPILNKDNQVQYIVHIVKDLTEYVKLEKIYVSEENISNTLPDLIHSLESTLLNRQKKSKSINEKLHQRIIKQNIELENLTKDISDYKLALDASDIVAITDEKGIIQYANDNFSCFKCIKKATIKYALTIVNTMKITINNSFERLVNAIATSPIVMNNKIQNVFQITERFLGS